MGEQAPKECWTVCRCEGCFDVDGAADGVRDGAADAEGELDGSCDGCVEIDGIDDGLRVGDPVGCSLGNPDG